MFHLTVRATVWLCTVPWESRTAIVSRGGGGAPSGPGPPCSIADTCAAVRTHECQSGFSLAETPLQMESS